MADIAPVRTYSDLETLLGRQKVASVLCTLEMDEVSPLAAPVIEQTLDRMMTSFKRISSWPQATWTGKDAQLQWLQSQLQFTARIYGDLQHDPEKAASFAAEKLKKMISAVTVASKVRFVALILELQSSGMDLPPMGPYLASFVRWPTPNLADAEWRVASRYDDRYFVNWLVGVYETREFRVAVPVGRSETVAVSPPNAAVLKDRGLRLRVDANTKVNIADGKGPIEVEAQDVDRLHELAVSGVASAVRALKEHS